MRIIISPAKKMTDELDFLEPETQPVFLKQAAFLKEYLASLSLEMLQSLLACNREIAQLNYMRYQTMSLNHHLVPALLVYDGIQYQYMAPQIFEQSYFDYVQAHVRILSGLYGVLRPLDGITPYRLEMQAKLHTPFCKNLYDYWKDYICQEVIRDTHTLINLASEEYSRTVLPYLPAQVRVIHCVFGEEHDGKVKEKGVYVKMARGEMVRFMAERQTTDPEQIKTFDRLGFRYAPALSDTSTFVFLMEQPPGRRK